LRREVAERGVAMRYHSMTACAIVMAVVVLVGCSALPSEEPSFYTLNGTVKGKSVGPDPDHPSSCKIAQGVNDPVEPRMDVRVEIPNAPFAAHGMLGEGAEHAGDCIFHFTIDHVQHTDSAASTYLWIGDVEAASIEDGDGTSTEVMIHADEGDFVCQCTRHRLT
jgi:hypothetical protein